MNENETKETSSKSRSAWEIKHGLVARDELRGHILSMMDDLDDQAFHAFFQLIYSLHGSEFLYKMVRSQLDDHLAIKKRSQEVSQ